VAGVISEKKGKEDKNLWDFSSIWALGMSFDKAGTAY